MKIITALNLIFYISLSGFIYSIPHTTVDFDIYKIILFLLTLVVFILLSTFYIMVLFNKRYLGIKKYIYLDVACMVCGIVTFLTLGHTIYKKTDSILSILFLELILIILFLFSVFLQYKIKKILANNQYNLMKEVKMFSKMGQALEGTPLMKAGSKIEYLLYFYAITIAVVENIYIFSGIVGIILILSTKHLKVIKDEFLKSGFISVKETYLSIISYYFFYLLSIVWIIFIPNLSVLLVGSASLLVIKIYIHRIANKLYDEKNDFS